MTPPPAPPPLDETLLLAVESALASGDEVRAAQLCGFALRALPDDPAAGMAVAQLQFHRGAIDDGFHRATAILGAAPLWGGGWRRLAVRLEQAGRLEEALAAYSEHIALDGGPRPAMEAVVGIARRLFRFDLAERFARTVAESHPEDWVASFNHALILLDQGRLEDSAARARRAADLGGSPQEVAGLLSDIGFMLKDSSRLEEAVAVFRDALRIAPRAADIHSNLLLTLCYMPGVDGRALLDEHRAFGAKFSHPFDPLDFPNDPDPDRRIRLGYVSPDFRRHVVAHMMDGLISRHDRAAFEVFCYAEVAAPDAMTETLRSQADHWRSTVGRSDEEVAAMIRADWIDVLVDLAGHTANNRLTVFGLKPAPVQASWLGYPNTTGMAAIDHLLLPLPADQAVEAVIPGPVPLYLPREELPLPAPPPCLARGYPTFGCFANASKLNDDVIALWARILDSVPRARLLLKAAGLGTPAIDAAIIERFTGLGVDPGRITVQGPSRYRDFMLGTAEIDVALDPFPYGGATTTLDMLHMGVPVVTLDSTDPRMAAPWILFLTGLRELRARDRADYVRIAVELATDPARLCGLRRALRNRLARSRFGDVGRLTRELEAIWRDIWRQWADRKRKHRSGA